MLLNMQLSCLWLIAISGYTVFNINSAAIYLFSTNMLTIMYRLTSYSAEQQPRHILDVPLHDIIHDIHARTVLRVIYNRNRK